MIEQFLQKKQYRNYKAKMWAWIWKRCGWNVRYIIIVSYHIFLVLIVLITHLTQSDLLLSYNHFLLNKFLAVIQPACCGQERILLNDLLIRIFAYSVNIKRFLRNDCYVTWINKSEFKVSDVRLKLLEKFKCDD